MTQPSPTPDDVRAAEMKAPFPDRSPFGELGRAGSPDAYLIDPGAGSGSDHVRREWPSERQLDDIARRGGSITPLYAARSGWPADRERADRAEAALRMPSIQDLADQDQHIFEWFNDLYPAEMVKCLAAMRAGPKEPACPICTSQRLNTGPLCEKHDRMNKATGVA